MKSLNCILLVDDNEDDNLYHKIVIRKVNAADKVIAATTGREALDFLKNHRDDSGRQSPPELIFLDINMPGMNGFEFLEKIKNENLIDTGTQAVIIMLTSSLNPSDREVAGIKYSREIKEFRNKPLTTGTLKEIIEKYF